MCLNIYIDFIIADQHATAVFSIVFQSRRQARIVDMCKALGEDQFQVWGNERAWKNGSAEHVPENQIFKRTR